MEARTEHGAEAEAAMREEAARLLNAGAAAIDAAVSKLSGPARELLVRCLADERNARWAVAADERIEENSDGTLIVKLTVPITFDGKELHRLTVRKVKVRDVRAANAAKAGIDAYADALVSPAGAAGELESDFDNAIVQRAAGRQLGKYLEGGAPS